MKNLLIVFTLVISKILQAAVALSVYLVLCELYREVVVSTYSFGGFHLAVESRHELVIPVLLVFLLIVPSNARNINSLFILISFYFLLLPAAVLCAMQGNDFLVFVWMSLAVVSVKGFSYLTSRAVFADGRQLIDHGAVPAGSFWVFFAIMLSVLTLLAAHVNFALRFSFAEVYDHRFDFNESLNFPLNYLLPFAAGPLTGLLAVLAASRREWLKLMLVFLCGALFYGFSTHKANLFFPLLAVAVYYAIRSRIGLFYVLSLIYLTASTAALVVGENLADLFGAVFANRLVFIPAQIHYTFFKEFSDVGFLYWAESKAGLGLFPSPIPISSVNYIAEIMTGDARIAANVGWIANGYMNLGLVGILIYAAILGFLFAIIGRWSRDLGNPILAAIFSVPLFSIVTSNDLLVAMLTGGVILMLVMLWFLLNWQRFSLRYKNVEFNTVQN